MKSPTEVFEAIVDLAKMSNYFISHGSAPMEENRHIVWTFPQYDIEVPVKIVKIVQDLHVA